MKKLDIKFLIGVIVIVIFSLSFLNLMIFIDRIESKDIEHSGLITMKWKVDKLIIDHYKFEIDNSTVLDIDNEYIWYKYEEGDIYT